MKSSSNSDPENNKGEKKCFFITPIGPPGSHIRRTADGLLNSVLKPAVSKFGYTITPAHQLAEPGSITNQVLQHIIYDDLVIADLTGLNPNVMYELGVRHAAQKSAIIIAHEDTELPFDIIQDRTIFFINDFQGQRTLYNDINQVLSSLEGVPSTDNPVYRAVQIKVLTTGSRERDSGGQQEIGSQAELQNYLVNSFTHIDIQLRRLLKRSSMAESETKRTGLESTKSWYLVATFPEEIKSRPNPQLLANMIELELNLIVNKFKLEQEGSNIAYIFEIFADDPIDISNVEQLFHQYKPISTKFMTKLK